MLEVKKRIADPEYIKAGGSFCCGENVAGETSLMIGPLATALLLIQQGKQRGVAISSKQRISKFPQLPTVTRGLLKFDLLGYWRSEVNSQLIDLYWHANCIKRLSTVIYENFNKPLDR